ncbi:hypothetical protein C818_03384 [Lachnospiraceae bacterium MD308]|jgi:hypothetical protein|nr:hypothetical protein C818_03384 [Lachnospiraceae bacterium MD308]
MKGPNVNIYKIQMAYFFREKSPIRTFGLISSLYAQLKDVFKTEPQSLPIPDEAPEDVPRCIWNDVNTSLTFNKVRLDFTFNIPSKFNWKQLLTEFNKKITVAIDEQEIIIDRVGLVSELMSADSLHELLKEYIQINKFNDAGEANISWLESIESYNVWTYFTINESKDINKIVFDINSLPECKLADQGTTGKEAMDKCAELLKGKMINVL